MRPPFIVLEGVEGAGKTTQVARLSAWLTDRGVRHRVTREPGGTPVGEAIRSVVLDRPDLDVEAETELFLILAARAAFVRQVVKPALDAEELVLADRYDFSTMAYQGYGRELALDRVRELNAFATGGLRPDLVVVLDVPVKIGIGRQHRSGKVADRMESEGSAFLERVRAGYRALAEADPDAELIDAAGSESEVHRLVVQAVESRFAGTFDVDED